MYMYLSAHDLKVIVQKSDHAEVSRSQEYSQDWSIIIVYLLFHVQLQFIMTVL